MRTRLVPLFAATAALLLLCSVGSASAAIEILNRGITPNPPAANQNASITVDVKVGAAPYIIEFFCCDAFKTDPPAQTSVRDDKSPETQRTSGSHTFTFNAGPAGEPAETRRSVVVRVSDSAGDSVTRNFVFQPPQAAPPPPETVAECPATVTFELIRARTTGGGCWQKLRAGAEGSNSSGVEVDAGATFYETSDRFVFNGIPFPSAPSGFKYVLAEPTPSAPGGQLGIDRFIQVKLGPVTVLSGTLLWKLPTGTSEGRLAAFEIPEGTLGGLPIGGEVAVLFRKRGDSFATSFPITVTLPSIFKPSPGTVGSITAATEITTDDTRGVSLDGGRVEVANAAIGNLAIHNLCFSYLSADVSTEFAACEPPSLNGAPAVSCSPPPRTLERFDGALLIGLPTPTRPDLAAYGGIAGGAFAYGGGFIDNAGIPLVQGITLERIGFGLCLRPTLLLKADVGLAVARGVVRGDVSLTYAEPAAGQFFVELAGFLRVADIPVGNGRIRVASTGSVDFNLAASLLLAGGFVQINGNVGGFLQPSPLRFNIDGSVSLCLQVSVPLLGSVRRCATGSAVVSNLGAGGCADLGFIGQFSAFFFYDQPPSGRRTDFGRGCGFQERVRVRPARAAQAGALTFTVPDDNDQYLAHVAGTGAPPKIKVTSPTGKTFESGPDRSTSDLQSYLIVENPDANETSIFLSKDAAAGAWKVEPLASSSALRGIETQAEEKEPTVVAGSVRSAGADRIADLRFFLRPGDRIALDVIGPDFQQSIAPRLEGGRCTGDDKAPGHSTGDSRCAEVRFTPVFGHGGPRTVTATVSDRNGATVDTINVARFEASPPPVPTEVPDVRLVRTGRTVFAIWGVARRGTTRYGSYVRLSDGRRLGHTAPKNCFTWRIRNVAPRTAVTLRIQAGRQDLRFGRPVTTRLRARSRYAGPARLRNARIPRPCASL